MKEIGVSKKIFENSCFNEHVGKKGLAITVKVYPFNRKRERRREVSLTLSSTIIVDIWLVRWKFVK